MGRRRSTPDWFLEFAPGADELALKQAREGVASPRVQKLRKIAASERARPKTLAEMVELLTPKQVAAYLKCSQAHVYDLVQARVLVCQPDQSRVMIAVPDLHDYLSAERRKRYG